MLDRDGEKIGTIEEIFLVEETGQPEWALVRTGRLKGHTTLVPLTKAHPVDKGIEVPYKKALVSEAPEIEADGEPSEQQVDAVYRHYGIGIAEEPSADKWLSASPQPSAGPDATRLNGDRSDDAPAARRGTADLRGEPIGGLLKRVSAEASTLVGQEIKLAKAEMTDTAKDVGIGAGMFGGAGYVAHLAGLALMLSIVFALATAMPAWLAALIVAVLFGALAAVLALTANKRIRQAGPPVPEETIESVKQTMETVKEEAKWGLGQTR